MKLQQGMARAEREGEEQHRELEALREADRLKDQFISIMSHELRTPINAITGFGSILDDELIGPLLPEQHRYLTKMLEGADRLLGLIDDLLDTSRIQSGKFLLTPTRISFPEVAERIVNSLAGLAQQKHQALVNEVPQALPEVVADPQRVGQVLTNLINNAIKFTPEGGTIVVRSHGNGTSLRCEVSDTGIGISREDVPRLFQRFSQLDMSSTRQYGGAGLGLNISKALVTAHGGEIGVLSVPGKGSTFWFTLPLEGPPGAFEPGGPSSKPDGHR